MLVVLDDTEKSALWLLTMATLALISKSDSVQRHNNFVVIMQKATQLKN
jgi:uncharacterized membrane protein (DUF441 family)